jgi:type I restriction enzyme M protein
LNLFYNTGIVAHIWGLISPGLSHHQGKVWLKVQLIDATQWFQPLRKNLGKKNCELREGAIDRICQRFLAFEETAQSKIFDNAAFGHWKVTVDRPLRIQGIDPSL